MKANTPLKVHPAAEAYRLMTEDELASLAADIAENGLNDSIILGRVKGSVEPATIVDGRNRTKACEMAGVVPAFETRDFADEEAIRAFVKSRSERRDLTKGQRAMGHAILFPEPADASKNARKDKTDLESKSVFDGFSSARLSQARAIFRHSPDMARSVRDGALRFDEALAKVKEAQTLVQSAEGKLARLGKEAPDLAELVTEDRMSLDEAIAALDERVRTASAQEASKREAHMRLSEALYRGAIAWASEEFAGEVSQRLHNSSYRDDLRERLRFDPGALDAIKVGATRFFDALCELRKDETNE